MIQRLIKENKIKIFFQPIVSIADKKIFAYEALTRAYDENNEMISPLNLFELAREENYLSQLDCYVRKIAIKKFQKIHNQDKDILLFLNFESSIIDNELDKEFVDVVKNYEINPQNIVIEIKEDKVRDNYSLIKFSEFYREHKFIIAIDDFGAGYSSFDRLALLKPNIVKVDRSLIFDVNKNFINSEILKAITKMCHKIGSRVLAEGVESKGEILNCMKKDIDIFQGFYFSKAKKNIKEEDNNQIKELITNIGNEYKRIVKEHLNIKKGLLQYSRDITKTILSLVEKSDSDYTKEVKKLITECSDLEAIYMINYKNGLQVGETIINVEEKPLFKASKDGDDHSLKEYFITAKQSSRGDYLSGKYISHASGNMCRTYSTKIKKDQQEYIVCIDIIV